MRERRHRKCLNCRELFRPDRRNVRHQRYCSAAECRRASHAASQRRWLDKPENHDYFKGPEQVARVQRWRAAHPGYARRRLPRAAALQDDLLTQPFDPPKQSGPLESPALQEVLSAQPLVLIGLIAHLTDCALQDDIVRHTHRLQQLARDVLSQGAAHAQTSVATGAVAARAAAVQLDRSPPGA